MQPTTIENDVSGFSDLKDKLLNQNNKVKLDVVSKQLPIETPVKENKEEKKSVFFKGDNKVEVDEDALLEFMADKKPVKLTLRELKDRAAGDVAIKNRMHALAEEKKKIQATLTEFAKISKDDPLGALQYLSSKVNSADTEFSYDTYLEKLAEQAEKLSQMDEPERKAHELEKKLSKAEQELSLKERENVAVLRKQQILAEYPEITDHQFGQMVATVLDNDELLDGVKSESDLLNVVEDLIEETLVQRDLIQLIREVNPEHSNNQQLLFALSSQLKQNPDLDEEDIRDIVREVITPQKITHDKQDKIEASKQLSKRQLASNPVNQLKADGASDADLLAMQLIELKEKQKLIKSRR